MRLTTAGFTLIEMMIVVVVIAILAAIALPSYNNYVMRSRIIGATSELADRRVRMEQFFLDNRTYAGGCPASTTGQSFTITCVSDATTYTITATGYGSMAGFTYTINQANNRRTTAVPSGWTAGVDCWTLRKTSNAAYACK
jgi:type IV pilus assembly protein PilE